MYVNSSTMIPYVGGINRFYVRKSRNRYIKKNFSCNNKKKDEIRLGTLFAWVVE